MDQDEFIDIAKEMVSTLTITDIDNIMIRLGGTSHGDYVPNNMSIRTSNPFLSYQTICHLGDSHSLKYFINKRKFFCYSHCRESVDVIGLVQKIKECKMLEAMKWIATVVNYDLSSKLDRYFNKAFVSSNVSLSDEESFYKDLRIMVNTVNSNSTEKWEAPQQLHRVSQEQYVDLLNKYDTRVKRDWYEESITLESFKHFNCRTDINKSRVIIPHRDINGDYIGVRVRNFQEKYLTGEHKRKYCPLTTHINGQLITLLHPLGENLYGIYENQQCIRESKKVVIFEGEKSVIKLNGFYGEGNNSVAICGSGLSGMKMSINKQMQLLMSLGVEEIIIAYDKLFETFGNSEELNKRKMISEKMQPWKMLFNVKVIWDTGGLLEYRDSPIDKGVKVFEELLSKAVLVK